MLRCVLFCRERIDSILLYKNGSWAVIVWFSSISQHFTKILPSMLLPFHRWEPNLEVLPRSRAELEKLLPSLLIPGQLTATSWYVIK